MSSTSTIARRPPAPLNGVDTPTLFATIDAVRNTPDLARFQFRARNEWVKGTNSRTTIHTFSGAGGEQAHAKPFTYDADHPAVLVGGDRGPTPVEFLLHALASCITAGIGNIAAARGITLTRVESTVEGDINLQGILGLAPVRNGYDHTFGPMLVQQIAGGDVKWEQLPVYLAAEFLAGALAALCYAFVAHTPADKRAVAAGIDLADPEDAPLTQASA